MRESNPELHHQRVSDSLRGKYGKEARRWKGTEAGYVAKHLWIVKCFGNAKECSLNIDHKAKRFEWHNLSREYKREIDDWMSLCPSCHRKIHKGDFCKKGHRFTPENTYINPKNQNWRDCKICRREAQKRYVQKDKI